MSKLPTAREEITYKVVETYEQLLNSVNNGTITMAQLDCAIKALTASVGWFLDKDTLMLLSETPIEQDESFLIKRTFQSKVSQKVVFVKRHPSRCAVEIWKSGYKLPVIKRSGDSVDEGVALEGEFVKTLTNQNYVEL